MSTTVTLHVDNDLAVKIPGDFCHPVGARAMSGVRHPHHATEALYSAGNPPVVGGDHNGVDTRRSRSTAIHVLDHRSAGDRQQRFAGEARRRVAGRDRSHDTRAAGGGGGRGSGGVHDLI